MIMNLRVSVFFVAMSFSRILFVCVLEQFLPPFSCGEIGRFSLITKLICLKVSCSAKLLYLSQSIPKTQPALGLCALLEIIGSTSPAANQIGRPNHGTLKSLAGYKWPYGAAINGLKHPKINFKTLLIGVTNETRG